MSRKDQFESRRRARRRALQAVYQWQMTGQDASEILRQFLDAQDFSQVDVEYFENVVRGVASGSDALDEALQPFMDRPMKDADIMERGVLRIGAWELLHCPEIPFRVVLDEAIDLSHRFGSEQGHSFVNAVLDKAARKLRPIEANLPPQA